MRKNIENYIASWKKIVFPFRFEAGTSRGILQEKESWFIILKEKNGPEIMAGECSIIPGLSIDNAALLPDKIKEIISILNRGIWPQEEDTHEFPALSFALEMLKKQCRQEAPQMHYPSLFTAGQAAIPINGLIWMGDYAFMMKQAEEKLNEGYLCLKLKIGTLDWSLEKSILQQLRQRYTARELILRVDANGAYNYDQAREVMQDLAALEIHSIEQPIAAGQWEKMNLLCTENILPVALDEELIASADKAEVLKAISPQYIILKPSLLGGFSQCEEWVKLATAHQIQWWITSALESNIGLNAIAQWTYDICQRYARMPHQGLGTGKLYTHNFSGPLEVKNGFLHYDSEKNWNLEMLK